ncbi:MAG: RNA polymerase sigma factor [Jatrophihabitans sp.]
MDPAIRAVGTPANAAAPQSVLDVYRDEYLSLVRLARQLVDDLETAEDVVQDVFAAAQSAKSPVVAADPRRYLQTAVVNRARSALRRRRVMRAFAVRGTRTRDAPAADERALELSRREVMLRAIDALPIRQREVVVLRYYAELEIAEIGDMLGMTQSAVSSALSRATAKLVTVLKGSDDDD